MLNVCLPKLKFTEPQNLYPVMLTVKNIMCTISNKSLIDKNNHIAKNYFQCDKINMRITWFYSNEEEKNEQ